MSRWKKPLIFVLSVTLLNLVGTRLYLDYVLEEGFWSKTFYIGGGADHNFVVYTPDDTIPGHGSTVACLFPAEVEADGVFDEAIWQDAVWQTQTMIFGPEPQSDVDTGFRFATAADGKYLYCAFAVTDDTIHTGEYANNHKQDGVEVYIDSNNQGGTAYDDDVQIRVLAQSLESGGADLVLHGTGIQDFGERIKGGVRLSSECYQFELAIPLETPRYSIVPRDGLEIGFNAGVIDRDSPDEDQSPENKLNWSEKDAADLSWTIPGLFGKLVFQERSR
mgnify:FL=1